MKLSNLGLADALYNKNEKYKSLSDISKMDIIAQDKIYAKLGILSKHLESERNNNIEICLKIDQAVANGGEDIRAYHETLDISTNQIAKITGIDIDDEKLYFIMSKAYDIVKNPKRNISDNQILLAQNDVIAIAEIASNTKSASFTDIKAAMAKQNKQYINA